VKPLKTLILGTLLVTGSYCTQVSAAMINISYQGFSKGQLTVNQTLNGTSRNALAGMFQFGVNDVSGVTAFDIKPGGTIDAFCVELSQNLKTTGSVAYELVDGLTYFNNNQSLVTSISRLFSGFFDRVTNAVSSATFQMALWEIISDGAAASPLQATTSLSVADPMRSGSYRVSNRTSERAVAASWIGQLEQYKSDFSVYVLRSNASQDLLIVNPLATQVSAPATFALLLSAAFVVFTMRRRGTAPEKASQNAVG